MKDMLKEMNSVNAICEPEKKQKKEKKQLIHNKPNKLKRGRRRGIEANRRRGVEAYKCRGVEA